MKTGEKLEVVLVIENVHKFVVVFVHVPALQCCAARTVTHEAIATKHAIQKRHFSLSVTNTNARTLGGEDSCLLDTNFR